MFYTKIWRSSSRNAQRLFFKRFDIFLCLQTTLYNFICTFATNFTRIGIFKEKDYG